MVKKNFKTAIIIGFGGMGIRHFKALKKINFKVVSICEKDTLKVKKYPFLKNIKIVKNYKNLLKENADLVCIASNTQSRFKIAKDFITKSKIEKILIEKPLATSFTECKKLFLLAKKFRKKKIYVNTFRTISKNYEKIKKIFKQKNETVSHVFINSPSAGLGNMGSIFFDVGNYFLQEDVISVTSWIDKTKTINPRGKKFKDPGGYGIVRYNNNKKLFFDLSENTALPYEIIIKTQNFECKIDELNNKFIMRKRPEKLKSKPNYYYLYKPEIYKLDIHHRYDVVLMTTFSIKKLFSKRFKSNLDESLKAMEIVFASHSSDKIQNTIKFPLNKKFHNKKINFA